MWLISSIIDNVVPFTILLGILVFVHELGHFAVARLCGVRVEVFSLGFGKKIFSYKKGDTVYAISLIPLGGYVKMFGEQSGDGIEEHEKSVSYSHKKVYQRMAIVAAGPLMNLLFAVLVFGFIALRGEETRSARLVEVKAESAAAVAGLKSQDLVLSVNELNVRSFEELQNALNQFKNKTVQLKVQQPDETERSVTIAVNESANPNIFSLEKTIGQIDGVLPMAKGSLIAIKSNSIAEKWGLKTGDEIIKINDKKIKTANDLEQLLKIQKAQITVERNPALNSETAENASAQNQKQTVTLEIDLTESQSTNANLTLSDLGFDSTELYLEQIVPDSPAAKAELLQYDKLIKINSVELKGWEDVLNNVKNYNGGEALSFTIVRNGTEIVKKITPQMTSQMSMTGKEDKRYTIGILPLANIAQPEMTIVKDNIFAALVKGSKRSYDITVMTLMSFVRLFQGEVSHKNIGGMLSIGKAAKDSFAMGIQSFLMTMGILSISLFILNLLPIPVLDGGHLVFQTIELIKGTPLSGKSLEIAHQVGFALLMGLMFLSIFNDVTKFIFKG